MIEQNEKQLKEHGFIPELWRTTTGKETWVWRRPNQIEPLFSKLTPEIDTLPYLVSLEGLLEEDFRPVSEGHLFDKSRKVEVEPS